jgi:hypothetical protein
LEVLFVVWVLRNLMHGRSLSGHSGSFRAFMGKDFCSGTESFGGADRLYGYR